MVTEFNGKCKVCGTEMDCIHREEHCRYDDLIYYCKFCGTLLTFSDNVPITDSDWEIPVC